ncbi:MAG: glutamate-5-semialdehyde dehydrogenase [Bacteriovoracaceae bacterium]|nr:glutamate-5-semialdehyde dehydrogenase [Bacteriovoracaceae bacterium]
MSVEDIGKKAKDASIALRQLTEEDRFRALTAIVQLLRDNKQKIIAANEIDLKSAKEQNLSDALVDRLTLTADRIDAMAQSVSDIAFQNAVVGEVVSASKLDNGLLVRRERIPIGVLAMIFESRPNVVVDCSALAIKSANAIILKGGKEAYQSNKLLGELVRQAIEKNIPKDTIQVIDSFDREIVSGLLTLNKYVDLIIPRGGEGLVNFVYANATVPVIAHFKGLCHIYIHDDADLQSALDICLNAKVQRPGVCNAMETLIIHEKVDDKFLQELINKYIENGVELRMCEKLAPRFPNLPRACNVDWDSEYLDKILSIKLVTNEDEAIDHVLKHGTNHTEGIVAKDQEVIKKFINGVDASCVMVNASTRFNDGGQLGLGAELGISTTKIHAYGPMGASELTTLRFIVEGSGHIRT